MGLRAIIFYFHALKNVARENFAFGLRSEIFASQKNNFLARVSRNSRTMFCPFMVRVFVEEEGARFLFSAVRVCWHRDASMRMPSGVPIGKGAQVSFAPA